MKLWYTRALGELRGAGGMWVVWGEDRVLMASPGGKLWNYKEGNISKSFAEIHQVATDVLK